MNLVEGFCRSRWKALSTCRVSVRVPSSVLLLTVRGWSVTPVRGYWLIWLMPPG